MILAYSGEQVFNVWKRAPDKLVFFDLRGEQSKDSINLPGALPIDLNDLEKVFEELGHKVGVFVVSEQEQFEFITRAKQSAVLDHDIVLMKETNTWPQDSLLL